MRPERWLWAACLLLMAGCASASKHSTNPSCPPPEQLRPLLNSERIQSCFGSYGVEVIEQQGRMRISSLYSVDATRDGEQRVTRTLAVSEFADSLPDSLQEAYAAIRAGASMGATLQGAGWRVDKRHRYFGEVPASDTLRCMSGLPADYASQVLAVQVYDLWVVRDEKEVRFALLAELHDPRYLTLADLRQIYDGPADPMQQADAASQSMLRRAAGVCATR